MNLGRRLKMDIHYSRKRIHSLLLNGTEYPLVCVVAGPGYHKTQCVKRFVSIMQYKCVWLHLTTKDNYRDIFWDNFVSTTVKALPPLEEVLKDTPFPHSMNDTYTLIKMIANHRVTDDKVLFVIDNYASIEDDSIKTFIKLLIETFIDNLCIILISDKRLDLAQVGIPHQGEAFYITADDLKFSDVEIKDFFKYHDIDLTDSEASYILEKTDGWPMSLGSLISQYRLDGFHADKPIHNISHIMNLFEANYFSKYPKDIQKIFVTLSLLPRCSIDTIKSIEKNNTESIIEKVIENIFISFDYDTNCFVFQKMYREYLNLKKYLVSELEINSALEIAGDNFYNEHNVVDAIECYMAAKNYDKVVNTINHKNNTQNNRGYLDYALKTIASLPEDYKKDNLTIDLINAYFILGKMEIPQAEHLFLKIMDQLHQKERTPEETKLLGDIYAALGDIEMLKDTDSFVEYFVNAKKYLNGPSDIRETINYRIRNNQVFYLPSNEPGALDSIVEKVFYVTPYMESLTMGLGYGFEYLFAGEAELLRNNLDDAKDYLYKAVCKGEKYNQYDVTMNALFHILRIELSLGNANQIKKLYQEVANITSVNNDAELSVIKGFVDTWLYSHLDSVDKMPAWVKVPGKDIVNSMPIDYGRNLMGHSIYLVGKHDYTGVINHLRKYDAVFNERGMWQVRFSSTILECIALMHMQKIDEAVLTFKRAYDMAYANDIKFPFIEYGNLMRTMLGYVEKSGLKFDFAWLLDLKNLSIKYANNKTKVVQVFEKLAPEKQEVGIKLTKRELEVLQHLSMGLNREEISGELSITVNGVKKHITNIYSKLGAINRADAIRIATTNGYDL